jgi:Subtilase family/Immune inhibitor A-like, MAM domain
MTLRRRFSVPLAAVVAALVTCVIPAGRGGVALAGPNAPVDDGDSSAPPGAAAKVAFGPPQAALEYLQAHTPSGDELALRRAIGESVILRSGAFDPVTEALPGFAAGRLVTGGEKVFLVQFHHDLTPAERKRFEDAGVRFVDYIPSHAYVVQVASQDFAGLRGHALVRWLDAFRGGYKTAPILSSDAWTEALHLDIRLLPGENPMTLLDRLQAIDAGVTMRAIHGDVAAGATLRVLVPAGHLHPFVERAADDASVWSVEPWYLPETANDDAIWVEQSYDTVNTRNYAITAPLWNHGITGTGQTPGISDTGLDDDMCFFRLSGAAGDVTAAQSPVLPGTGIINLTRKVPAYYVEPQATSYDGNTVCNGKAESFHGTHTSGTITGDNFLTLSTSTTGGHDPGDGMAPNARLIFQDVGSEVTGCLDGLNNDYHLLWKQAYDAGVRVHSNSWGSSVAGAYTSDSRTIDEIVYGREDLLIVFSAGNDGPGATTVGSPATSKDSLAVGATGHAGSTLMASFSSRGPALDGRIKPDIVAPGTSTVSAAGDASNVSNNCATKILSGTSMAAPTVSGGATLLRQYFTDGFYPTGAKTAADVLNPSAALMRAALINGAIDIINPTQATMFNSLTPDNNQGFGRIHLDNVAFFSTPVRDTRRTRVWDKWNAVGLRTGDVDEYPLQVTAGQPLKVSLAWTDPEASGLAAAMLINNLDLEVVDPANVVYSGNVLSGGQSVTGGSADALNTIEVVFLKTPAAGTWKLRVKGTAVPGAPVEPYSTRQGYALVATYADCLTAPAIPAGIAATDQGAAGISVTWGAAAGATRYQVYRAAGTCAAPLTGFHFLGQTTSTAYSDTLAQGGFSYAYKVRAVTDCTEGAVTTCVTATSTGNCSLFPVFNGLTSGINDLGTPACDSLLGWNAASSSCPAAPGINYDVYRSSTPYFTPGPATLLASDVVPISYRDTAVSSNTAYYYMVRAEDATTGNGGPSNGGNLDTNFVFAGVTPTSNSTYPGTWTDDGDTTSRLALDAPWRVSNQQNHTGGGGLAYHSAGDGQTYPSLTCAAATTPPIPLQAGQSPTLSYWVRHNLEFQWDGVVVEISTDAGANWTPIVPAGGYPDTLAQTGVPPVNSCGYAATQGAFTGPAAQTLTAWTQFTHDLTPFAGQTVMLRWRMSSDPAAEFEGFYLDDIAVTRAMAPSSCGADLRLASAPGLADTCAGGAGGNGILESGEDAVVSASLQNIGDTAASGVTGTLSTTQPGVVITRSTASFTDAAAGATTSSIAPHFAVWVAPTVACGTVIPFSLGITSAQGSFARNFSVTVGTPGLPCTQSACTSALPVEDGVSPAPLLTTLGSGTSVHITFGLSCHAVDSTVYWGSINTSGAGLHWSSAACGFGAQGSATFDPGTPPTNTVYAFVVVPSNGATQGSYGHTSAGAERAPAVGLGACNLPQTLGGTCP